MSARETRSVSATVSTRRTSYSMSMQTKCESVSLYVGDAKCFFCLTYKAALMFILMFWVACFLLNIGYLFSESFTATTWDTVLVASMAMTELIFLVVAGLGLYGLINSRKNLLLPYYFYQLFAIVLVFLLGIVYMVNQKLWSARDYTFRSKNETIRCWIMVIVYFVVHGPIGMLFALVYRQLYRYLRWDYRDLC